MGCTQSNTAQEQPPQSNEAPKSNAEQDQSAAPEGSSAEEVADESTPNGELEVDDEGAVDIDEIGVSGFKVSENGIVMYNVYIKGSGENPPHCVSKRYNDFKALHSALTSVMGESLPTMPKGGLITFLKRKNENLIKERKQAFGEMLTACASHDEAKGSAAFKNFLQ